ncbi:hypothetical protein RFI_09313 [Reticulomyxa filosa]|uniref:Uncharacterized protein n=1 Tax=Reticulomyxa filosa TaxID=46433 RepID=X6NNF7_RETFI|nr:hypothetical protein RFI_09313 [Reticulomyxa filosa]|eukprot:ETO27820.1 hypothetical protein RFI_09313 [Reticulomyxa filosa]
MLDWYQNIYLNLKDELPRHPWMYNRNRILQRNNVTSRRVCSHNLSAAATCEEVDTYDSQMECQHMTQLQLDSDSDITTIMQGDCTTDRISSYLIKVKPSCVCVCVCVCFFFFFFFFPPSKKKNVLMKLRKEENGQNELSTLYDGSDLYTEKDSEFYTSMLPPQQQISPGTRYDHLYKPLECIQAEGQVLYVPEFWFDFTSSNWIPLSILFHAVLNVGDVVAGAIQSSAAHTEWTELLAEVAQIEKELRNTHDSSDSEIYQRPLTDLEQHQRHQRLLAIHQSMLRLAPNNAVHHFLTGNEYLVIQQVRFFCFFCFENCIFFFGSLCLSFIPLLFIFFFVCMRSSKYDKAIEYFSNAIRLDPTYIEAYLSLSDAYLYSHHLKYNYDFILKVQQLLRIAYRLNPLHPQVKSRLAQLLNDAGQSVLATKVQNSEALPNMTQNQKQ